MSVDITIQETINEVDITVNQNVITVNVTRTTGSGGVTSVNGDTGDVVLTTDNVAEGSTNLYFTVARVRATILTGISFVSGAVITATDTVLSALGKLQKQISSIDLPYVLKISDRIYQEPVPQSGTTYTFEIDDRFKDLSLQGGGNEYLLNDDADLFPINSVIMFHIYDTPALLNYTAGTDLRYLGTNASADIPIEVGDDCRLKKIGSGSIWELIISNKSTGGGSGTVTSVTGDLVDNTDPNNPVINTPNIPTKTSDLTNDGENNTSTFVESNELGAVAFSNNYNDLDNKPTIPTPQNLAQVLAIDNKTNDIPIVSNNGNAVVYVNDDYVSLTYGSQSFAMTDDYVSLIYGSQSFAMTEDGVQLYSEATVVFDSTVSTDFNTPVLNYNGEEVATKNWVTSQGESISTAKIINRCPDDAFRNAHGNLKIGDVQYYGTRTSPSDLLRFPDLNDLSVFQKITLPSSGLGTIEYLNYNETLGKIYACLSTNKLLVINDIDDISDYDIIDLTLSQGSVNSSSVITTDDTHIYIGTRTSPNSYFIKLDATDYSEVLNEQWTGKADIHSFDWNYDKSELYFVIEGVNGYLAIINPIDLSFTEYLAGSNVTDDIAYILDANSPLSFDSWLFLPSEFRSLGDKGHSLFNLTTKVRYELDGLPSNGCKWDSDNFILYSACTNGFVEVWTGANLIASVFGAINPKSASTVYVNKEGLWLNEITKIDDRFFATAWNNEVENGGDGLGSLMELDLVNVNNGALSKKEEVIRNTFYINKEVSQALTSATSVDITFGEGYTWNLIASKKFGVNISPEDSFTAISLDKYYISNKTEVSFRINFNAPVTGTLNFTATIFPNY